MARITLDGLAHSYMPAPKGPEDYALKELNHVWADGEAYALLGPSGCGKSTLLNIISGLLEPSEGRILFDDTDVTRMTTAERNIAQVFQFPVVYDTMTVRDNLAFPLRNRGFAADVISDRVDKVARMIGMEAEIGRKARGLTADAKQKISLGRGMVREDVNALLFDEPLTVIDPHMKWELRTQLKSLHHEFGHTMIYVTHDQTEALTVIDPHMKWELRTQLKSLHHEFGHTMIYVTHDQTEALTFADHVVVMTEGQVVQIGTPQELFERPAHTFVGYFIGSPGMNVIPASVEGDRAIVNGAEIPLRSGYEALSGKVEIGVRPEFARLTTGEGVPIKIRRVEDVGRHKIVRAEMFGQEINVIAGEGAEIGADVNRVAFDPAGVNVYADDWLVEPAGGRMGEAA
jgi:glycerol transport system ATP-binding protein